MFNSFAPGLRRTLIGLALGLTVAAGALAQGSGQMPPPAVVVAPAEMTTLNDSATFTGRLVAAQKVDLRARVTGFLESVEFVEGARVAEGDVLFRIESAAYEAAVQQIEGQIVGAQADLALARLERDRQAELVARQASPQRNLDQAEAAIGEGEGRLMTLDAQLRQARLNLSYTEITAPFAGVVGLTAYDVGALVGPDSGPLVTLTRSDPIFADFPVSARIMQDFRAAVDRGEARPDATVSLRRANGATYGQTGRISFVDNVVAEGTDTIQVRATFANPDGTLKDGEFVVVRLEDTESSEVLTVPAQAVSRNLSGSFVMLVDADGTVSQRTVDTGATVQARTEIRGGLEEGDLVVTEGLNKVRPGIRVNAALAEAPDGSDG